MTSEPGVKSVTWPGFHTSLLNWKWSAPAAPVSLSAPWLAIRVSFPVPPTRVEPGPGELITTPPGAGEGAGAGEEAGEGKVVGAELEVGDVAGAPRQGLEAEEVGAGGAGHPVGALAGVEGVVAGPADQGRAGAGRVDHHAATRRRRGG